MNKFTYILYTLRLGWVNLVNDGLHKVKLNMTFLYINTVTITDEQSSSF